MLTPDEHSGLTSETWLTVNADTDITTEVDAWQLHVEFEEGNAWFKLVLEYDSLVTLIGVLVEAREELAGELASVYFAQPVVD